MKTPGPRLRIVPIVVVLLAGSACATRPPAARTLTATRVRATPVPVVTPAPPPAVAETEGFPDHPPLDNPGGGLLWVPSADAGPWRTNGTIALPSLGVSAPIVRVGVDRSGQMVTPRNARDVAWLDQGPLPGRTQNVVLAGHRNWSGRTGSFDGLARLRPGDPVTVSMDDRTWTFAVTWVRLYDPKQAPADKLMGRTDRPTVTLITCGGSFDRSVRHYRGRMIARAEMTG